MPLVRAVVATGRLDAPIAGGERLHEPRTHQATAVRPAPLTGSASVAGPFAARLASAQRDRTALDAHGVERLQQLRARAEARLRAEEAIRARRAASPHAPRSQGVRP
jgi:hypothetical protein